MFDKDKDNNWIKGPFRIFAKEIVYKEIVYKEERVDRDVTHKVINSNLH